MRLDKVFIDGFKNLRDLEVDFDEHHLTTVLIGQNGAGKSNLIEAIAQVFRWVDLRRHEPRFRYRIDYRIQPRSGTKAEPARVTLSGAPGKHTLDIDGREVKRTEFEKRKHDWFPDLVFGYYSGSGRQLEGTFDRHQANYYKSIARNPDETACYRALVARRLFYCRPVHGAIALLALFAFSETKVGRELKERLGITGFHSALVLFREPWYAKGGKSTKASDAANFWGAEGLAGRTAAKLKELAFHPFGLPGNAIDDYRDKKQDEAQYATFLKDTIALRTFGAEFSDDSDMFYALEALDVSDLIREAMVWVTRDNDATGDVGYSDLSDGERQLLMVLGLIRVSRGKRVLFLLDEPDTHLNPHWQHSYLDLIKEWTGIAADADKSQIVLTTHNPLTISALTRQEVRVMQTDKATGRIQATPPFVDPKGLGISGVLTDIFGMPSTLDRPTQELIDKRNKLARLAEMTMAQAQELEVINDELRKLGFMYQERDELYREFLRKLDDVELADAGPLSLDELQRRDETTREIIEQLLKEP
jgi:ABC-type cobalamin/Fe3+-siderophores transport system ATPase subunit